LGQKVIMVFDLAKVCSAAKWRAAALARHVRINAKRTRAAQIGMLEKAYRRQSRHEAKYPTAISPGFHGMA